VELHENAITVLEAALSLGVPALVVLVFGILGALGLEHVVVRAKAVARSLKSAVDEPTDPLVVLAEHLAEAILQRDVDPELVQRVLEALQQAAAQPPVEVSLEETLKL